MRSVALMLAASMLVLLSLTGSRADAQGGWTTIFRDDFNSAALDTTVWSAEQSNGSYDVSGGWLNLRSIPNGFPQIASKPGIVPPGTDIKLRFGFQFGNTTCYGSAIGARVLECLPECGCPPYYSFHRDCAVGTDARMPSTNPCSVAVTSFESSVPSYHIGELVIYADSIAAVVDGTTIYSSKGHWPAPTAVWMGSVGSPCCLYTDVSVDFVEIEVPAATRTRSHSWGALKAVYR